MRRYRLSMIPGGVSPAVHVSKGDTGYSVRFILEGFSVPSGASVAIEGIGTSHDCTYSGSNVDAPINADITAKAGVFPAEIVIRHNGERIGTANIALCVEEGIE